MTDRLSRIRATYERGDKRMLWDAGEVTYLLAAIPYLLKLVDEFMPKQRVLFEEKDK